MCALYTYSMCKVWYVNQHCIYTWSGYGDRSTIGPHKGDWSAINSKWKHTHGQDRTPQTNPPFREDQTRFWSRTQDQYSNLCKCNNRADPAICPKCIWYMYGASQHTKTCIMVKAVVSQCTCTCTHVQVLYISTFNVHTCTSKKYCTGPISSALHIRVVIEQETGSLTLFNLYVLPC